MRSLVLALVVVFVFYGVSFANSALTLDALNKAAANSDKQAEELQKRLLELLPIVEQVNAYLKALKANRDNRKELQAVIQVMEAQQEAVVEQGEGMCSGDDCYKE